MSEDTKVEPTDVEHVVGDDEYFFSTTDAKGVIEQANSVFVRLSRYDHERLAGAPHNIIRHPDMPGGAFRLVWDQLESGRISCAYVKNMAADGGTYWVFATLLPVGDTYLSVRMSPMATDLKDTTERLYAQVRATELAAREAGTSRHEAAGMGYDLLMQGLAPLGIRSADELTMAALPTEVALHERVSALPRREGATGLAADVLGLMHDIESDTATLVAQLEEYEELVGALEASAADAGPASERLTDILEAVSDAPVIESAPEMLGEFTERITEKVTSAIDQLAALDGSLTELARHVRHLRMRIALLRLHNRMVGTFCAELIDGATSFDAGESLLLLARALTEGATELSTSMTRVRAALAEIPTEVQNTVRDADRTLRLSTKWRGEAGAASGENAAALAPTIDALEVISVAGFDELRRFYDVAARCQFLPDTFDADRLSARVAELEQLVGELRSAEAA